MNSTTRKSFFTLVVLVLIGNVYSSPALTKKAMDQTSNMLKGTCMKKTGVKQEQLNPFKDNKPTDDREAGCYFACLLQMMMVIKKDKLNTEAAVKQINMMLPDTDNMRQRSIAQLEACGKETGADGCELALNVVKCFLKVDPGNNLIPL